MPDQDGGLFAGSTFNVVRHRGDPQEATLASGHVVKKEEHIYYKNEYGQHVMVKCAEYHGAHFLYADPVYNLDAEGKGHWFAMCTCGAPAVVVGPTEAMFEESGHAAQLLVCYVYHATLRQFGFGWHQGSEARPWR